jgi:hypothetical protein
VTNDLDDLGLAPAADLAVEAIEKVQETTDEFPSPAFISNAVVPEVVMIEWRKWVTSVSDEAASSMGVHAEQERDEQVVGVPESLERLLANPVMGCGVDQKHAEQHDVASDTASFCVVDLKSDLRPDLDAFNVEKTIVVSILRNCRDVGTYLT